MLKSLQTLRKSLIEDREALIAGNFSNLKARTQTIEQAISELEKQTVVPNREAQGLLEDVQAIAARNAGLLKAGLEGTKAAIEKVEMIKRASLQLNTYSSDGTVEDVSLKSGKIEKRA